MEAELVIKVAVVAAILLALWVWPDWVRYRARARRVGRALQVSKPPPPQPTGPPIEQIAADLRRVRGQIQHAPPGMPVAKKRGWLAAYDDLLVAACRALQLDERLRALPDGPERDLERERIERLLMRAGLRLGSPV